MESWVLMPWRDEEAPEGLRRCEERPPLDETVDPLVCDMMDEVDGNGAKSSALLEEDALASLDLGRS